MMGCDAVERILRAKRRGGFERKSVCGHLEEKKEPILFR